MKITNQETLSWTLTVLFSYFLISVNAFLSSIVKFYPTLLWVSLEQYIGVLLSILYGGGGGSSGGGGGTNCSCILVLDSGTCASFEEQCCCKSLLNVLDCWLVCFNWYLNWFLNLSKSFHSVSQLTSKGVGTNDDPFFSTITIFVALLKTLQINWLHFDLVSSFLYQYFFVYNYVYTFSSFQSSFVDFFALRITCSSLLLFLSYIHIWYCLE